MSTKLYKNGDSMGIWTDAKDEREFLDEVCQLLGDMIGEGLFIGDETLACDWEFQFSYWIPQIVEICCKYKGYKSEVLESRVLFYGNVTPSDFIAEVDSSRNSKCELGYKLP